MHGHLDYDAPGITVLLVQVSTIYNHLHRDTGLVVILDLSFLSVEITGSLMVWDRQWKGDGIDSVEEENGCTCAPTGAVSPPGRFLSITVNIQGVAAQHQRTFPNLGARRKFAEIHWIC